MVGDNGESDRSLLVSSMFTLSKKSDGSNSWIVGPVGEGLVYKQVFKNKISLG